MTVAFLLDGQSQIDSDESGSRLVSRSSIGWRSHNGEIPKVAHRPCTIFLPVLPLFSFFPSGGEEAPLIPCPVPTPLLPAPGNDQNLNSALWPSNSLVWEQSTAFPSRQLPQPAMHFWFMTLTLAIIISHAVNGEGTTVRNTVDSYGIRDHCFLFDVYGHPPPLTSRRFPQVFPPPILCSAALHVWLLATIWIEEGLLR